MKNFVWGIGIIFAAFIQATVLSLPLIVGILILFFVKTRKSEVFFWAFLFGIVYDMVTVKTIGFTSMYLISLMGVVGMYQKKFELDTIQFVILFTFLGTLGFLFINGGSFIWQQALCVAFVGGGIFEMEKKIQKKKTRY